jgi:hypothetical protein
VLHTDLCASCDPPIGVDGWLLPDLALEALPIAALTGVVHQVGDQFLISPRYSNEITFVPLCDEGSCAVDCACPPGQVCGDEGCDWPACTCVGADCAADECGEGLRCLYMLEQAWSSYDAVCAQDPARLGPCVVWSYAAGGNGHTYSVHGFMPNDEGPCDTASDCVASCGSFNPDFLSCECNSESKECLEDQTETWADARLIAGQTGAHLITLTSEAEMSFLHSYLTPLLTGLGFYGHGPFLDAQQAQFPGEGGAEADEGWSWSTPEVWDSELAAGHWQGGAPYYDGGSEGSQHCLALPAMPTGDDSFKSWRAWPCNVSSAWTVERPSAVDNKPALEAASSLACRPSNSDLAEGGICGTSEECAAPLQCLHGKCRAVCQTSGNCSACSAGFDSVDQSVNLGLCKD